VKAIAIIQWKTTPQVIIDDPDVNAFLPKTPLAIYLKTLSGFYVLKYNNETMLQGYPGCQRASRL